MKIEVLLTEAEICEEFADAIEARDLPEKFFYWSPLSVRAWLALSRDVGYESSLESWNLLVTDAAIVASQFDGKIALTSLGAGDGCKDVALLHALQAAGREVEYFPVDASQGLLEMACDAAEQVECDTLGIKADISSAVHLVLAADASESPKLYVMSGNTLGGFDPLLQMSHLAHEMKEADRLLIDFDTHESAALASRDGPVGRRFASGPLATLGLTREDGDVKFELRRDERREGLHLVHAHLQVARDLRIRVPDREVLVQRGERFNLNFSYTYTPEVIRWLIVGHAGLRILAEIPSPDGHCVTVLCAK